MEASENTLYRTYAAVRDNISKVVVGKQDIIDMLIVALLCRGHVLLEDVPGTGKTLLIKSLAASLDCSSKRIQFTPDLLPSDLTGINYFNMKRSEFEFLPGPVFSNIVLADEINRATPKTQSGLLECMEERQATIDGKTYLLEEPFIVVATQNPVETAGVYPLPEAELDRFLIKTSMNYPTHEESVDILDRFDGANPLASLSPVVSREDILASQAELEKVYVHRDIKEYISSVCEQTRSYDNVLLGVSPRGAQSLLRASKGFAAIDGRGYVQPDDIKRAAVPVLAHRLMLTSTARIKRGAAEGIISDILDRVPVPTERGLGYWQSR